MASDRRKFLKVVGATVAIAGTTLAATPAVAQGARQFRNIKALAFDAYGTLFDVFSVTALCEQLYPGKGNQLAQIWRGNHLKNTLQRRPTGRLHRIFALRDDGHGFAFLEMHGERSADRG